MNLSKNLLALLTVLLVINQSVAQNGKCCKVMGGRSVWRKIGDWPAKCAAANRPADNDCDCTFLKDSSGMKHSGTDPASNEDQCRRRLIV